MFSWVLLLPRALPMTIPKVTLMKTSMDEDKNHPVRRKEGRKRVFVSISSCKSIRRGGRQVL